VLTEPVYQNTYVISLWLHRFQLNFGLPLLLIHCRKYDTGTASQGAGRSGLAHTSDGQPGSAHQRHGGPDAGEGAREDRGLCGRHSRAGGTRHHRAAGKDR